MFKPVPFAEYEVTTVPDGSSIHVVDGDLPLVLDPTKDQRISSLDPAEDPDTALRILTPSGRPPVGRHVISRGPHGWAAARIGHPLKQNDIWLDHDGTLRDGDRISGQGVVFTFRLRPDLEELDQILIESGWDPRLPDGPLRDFLMERTPLGLEGTARALRHFALRRINAEQVSSAPGAVHDAVKLRPLDMRQVRRLHRLLGAGHDPNELDRLGQPPLRYVLNRGAGFVLEEATAEMVKALIGAGADPSVAGVGETLLAEAQSLVTSAVDENHLAELAQLLR